MDLDAVQLGVQRLAQRGEQPPRAVALQRGPRGDRAVQDEHAHLGARVARGERLAVRPDAQDGIGRPRVVLGDDGDLHRVVSVASVSAASARVT